MIRHHEESFPDFLNRLFPVPFEELEPGEKRLAKNITFKVTEACNLCCTYCYQGHKTNNKMSFETAKRFIDMLLDEEHKDKLGGYLDPSTSPGLIIEFIGGEPFLEIDLMDQITDYFLKELAIRHHPWATRYMISICSNGLLYFDPKVQAYLNKHKHHMSFSITIDGNKELHDSCRIKPDGSGSYDIAMAGVKDWIAKGHKMGSKITVAPGNVMYVFDAVKSIIENGYDSININCVFEEGWTEEHALILYNQLKLISDYMREQGIAESHYMAMFEEDFFTSLPEEENQNHCGGLGDMISVDWRGDIYPCIRYMESSLGDDQPPLKIGNVYDGILQKQCEKDCVKCMKEVTRRSQSTDECWYCPIAKGCAWCFVADTKILTPDGEVNIQDLKPGDEVLDAEGWTRKVKKNFVREVNDTVTIKTANRTITCTPDHPIAINNLLFRPALNITPGTKIVTVDGLEEVLENTDNTDTVNVYNLEVDINPTYIANGVIVHNCSAYNYQVFGTVNKRATFICVMHKARALANVYHWNKYYLENGIKKYFKNNVPDEWALKIISQEELDSLKQLEAEAEEHSESGD